ncbi:hypothetical protein K438DRAFT_1984434 [Mycena galopus ATCC 62051]|nr:hypothetical protein K438DRAFT_1984434 [Mycena galopus ATCC 62051]
MAGALSLSLHSRFFNLMSLERFNLELTSTLALEIIAALDVSSGHDSDLEMARTWYTLEIITEFELLRYASSLQETLKSRVLIARPPQCQACTPNVRVFQFSFACEKPMDADDMDAQRRVYHSCRSREVVIWAISN